MMCIWIDITDNFPLIAYLQDFLHILAEKLVSTYRDPPSWNTYGSFASKAQWSLWDLIYIQIIQNLTVQVFYSMYYSNTLQYF